MLKRILICLLFFFPISVSASADLAIEPQNISFSKQTFVAGDTVRIYARVYNTGDEDVSGYVTFYQGSIPLGDSQVISVIANGSPEDVYIDFIVPSGAFNIRAEIKGTDPGDINMGNNIAITSLFEPVLDDDRDAIGNAVDNCPNVFNPKQTDTDQDGFGNECDDDDDGDGLTDEVESEIGTNPLLADTDGDGVEDAQDAYPTDATRSQHEPEPKPEPKKESQKQNAVPGVLEKIIKNVASEISLKQTSSTSNDSESATVINTAPVVERSVVSYSANAVFSYTRKTHNTFEFVILSPQDDGALYEWDFGDGVFSNKTTVEHRFKQAGSYKVSLTAKHINSETLTETTVIFVPFFTLQNPLIATSVALLTLLLVTGITIIVFTNRKLPKRKFAQSKVIKKQSSANTKPKKIRVHDSDL